MVSCSSCGEGNAKKNYYCGACGGRMRPVERRLEQDILHVLHKRNRRNRARNIVATGLVLGALSYFGHGWVQQKISQTVAAQVETLKPTIIREASAKAEQMVNRELPTTLKSVMNTAVKRSEADLRNRGRDESQRLERISAEEEKGIREKGHELLAGLRAPSVGSVASASNAISAISYLSPTLNLLGNQGRIIPSDKTLDGGPTLSGNLAQFRTPDYLQNAMNTLVITQTTYTSTTPSCIGGISYPMTIIGAAPLTGSDECKSKSLVSPDGLLHPSTKQ